MASDRQLFKEVTAGKFKSVYYFFGSEDYRRSEAEKFVANHFLPDLQRSTNYRKIDARSTPVGELMASLANLPMLGEHEVYVVAGFESYKPKEIDLILKLLQPPDPNRVVILNSPSSKTPSKKSAFYKTVTGLTTVVEFKKNTPDESRRVISRCLSEHKLSIDGKALELLIGLVDGDRGGLESELNKLIDFKEPEQKITVEDIRQVCSGYELFNMFQLGDLIVDGDAPKTMKVIRSLLGGGTSADYLTMLLQQHFISVYLVKNGKSPVGRREFLISKFREQSKKYTNEQLERMIVVLSEANSELRHQRLSKNVVLEMLALSLSDKNQLQ